MWWYIGYCVVSYCMAHYFLSKLKDREESPFEFYMFWFICGTNLFCIFILAIGACFDGIAYLFEYIKQCRGE
ncbi:hypothetical protein [Providencia phage PSTRCR_121]|nr:hypothetical protein [Providencia phage PSTRCR_121]